MIARRPGPNPNVIASPGRRLINIVILAGLKTIKSRYFYITLLFMLVFPLIYFVVVPLLNPLLSLTSNTSPPKSTNYTLLYTITIYVAFLMITALPFAAAKLGQRQFQQQQVSIPPYQQLLEEEQLSAQINHSRMQSNVTLITSIILVSVTLGFIGLAFFHATSTNISYLPSVISGVATFLVGGGFFAFHHRANEQMRRDTERLYDMRNYKLALKECDNISDPLARDDMRGQILKKMIGLQVNTPIGSNVTP